MKKFMQTKTVLILSCFTCLLFMAACSGEGEPAMMVQEQEEVTPERPDKEAPYSYVEQMPEYKGSTTALLEFLGSNVKYPAAAKDAGVEGMTVLSFVVEKDGSVTDIQTVKSLSPETDQEAIRVVKLTSGDWTPGKQDGVLLRVKYTLPIKFQIK